MKSPFFSSSPISMDFGLLLLRIISGGIILLNHGIPKFQKILSDNLQFADPIGLGPDLSLYLSTFAEVICALLIVLGLFTRIAIIPLLINLSVAFFIFHAADKFGMKELPLLFLGMFAVLFFTGPGRFSIDNGLGVRRRI